MQEAIQVSEASQMMPIFLQADTYLVSAVLDAATLAHERRVMEGVHEPLVPDGLDIAHELANNFALALPTAQTGKVEIPLNTPEINFIRELLPEDVSAPYLERRTAREKRNAFEQALNLAAVRMSLQNEIVLQDAKLELTDEARERIHELMEQRIDNRPRRFNMRTSGAIPLQWALATYLDEEQQMRPKANPAFDREFELGHRTLSAFMKGKKFDIDGDGKERLMKVSLTRQEIDYLNRNIDILKSGSLEVYKILIQDVINGINSDYPNAPIVEQTKDGVIKRLLKRLTGQK